MQVSTDDTDARGINLLPHDHWVIDVTAERLDGQGVSTVSIRVAEPLPFVALKINALQLRHLPKDAYDIVYTLDNLGQRGRPASGRGGPRDGAEPSRTGSVRCRIHRVAPGTLRRAAP